ncbi:MAG: FAD-dependent oxidoreductase [Bacteroidales bacterium]|nr:FAD-dependent oxidoreductase [Bacteroidales bacterium]
MNSQGFVSARAIHRISLEADIVVAGGGLTGVCCALTAARRGSRVILVQDRPVLGGNASSEVRLWALGATSHMGNNNRWSREGGAINEIMTENVYRNKEGNPVIFDTVVLDIVRREPNITLLLDTVVYEVVKSELDTVESLVAYNPINETRYDIKGRFFADCTGDGLVSYLAGVPFRMGSEDKEVYSEGFAPDKEKYGELMGHTILFYMKDTGKPVEYYAPHFALQDVEKHISKIRNDEYFSIHHHGCKYWWIEYGGRLNTIHDSEEIKEELQKVVYGIWNYIKNSGKFPEMATYTLEWVGTIPGKRESRRMEGLYTLNQRDIIEQRTHADAVSYGGWAIDLHPSNGVYADGRACNQWHSKGVYQIPYRCYLGSNIKNLMFGGRIMSSSHVANGSTRVMCTSASGGQAIGMALALCAEKDLNPADLLAPEKMSELQRELVEAGQYIPFLNVDDSSDNLLNSAKVEVSGTALFNGYTHNGSWRRLACSTAALFPVQGAMPEITLKVRADQPTDLKVELRTSSRLAGFTPDTTIDNTTIVLNAGEQDVKVAFNAEFPESTYVFVCFMANEDVQLPESDMLITGTTTVLNQINLAVSNLGRQDPPPEIEIDSFEFWCPLRRPESKNIAFVVNPALPIFSTANMANALCRPASGSTNAWAAPVEQESPEITLSWENPVKVSDVTLFFDTDYDQAMETVQMGHYDNVMPYCVRRWSLADESGKTVASCSDNHQALNKIVLSEPVETRTLRLKLERPADDIPAALFHIIVK